MLPKGLAFPVVSWAKGAILFAMESSGICHMGIARVLPTIALVGVMVLVVAPVVVAFRGMRSKPEFLAPSSNSPNNSGVGSETETAAPAEGQGATSTKKGSQAAKVTKLVGFDGDRAYEYLVDQVKIGTRISGTEGNRTLRKRMAEHFAGQGAKVTLQKFEVRHPLNGEPVEMENVVASWNADRPRRVVIGAHFDTRPRADKEPTAKKRAEPFYGANDGGSGIAVLMELANLMQDIKTSVGVDLVAFDGEELVWDENGDVAGEYFHGSKHFAEQYRNARGPVPYVAGFVVDMVGGEPLRIYPDKEGNRRAGHLVQEIWAIARRLKATGFKTGQFYDVSDDHWPLLEVGIPAIDIIDFSYKHWHLTSDTADKCSAASLAQVGGVVAEWLRGK